MTNKHCWAKSERFRIFPMWDVLDGRGPHLLVILCSLVMLVLDWGAPRCSLNRFHV